MAKKKKKKTRLGETPCNIDIFSSIRCCFQQRGSPTQIISSFFSIIEHLLRAEHKQSLPITRWSRVSFHVMQFPVDHEISGNPISWNARRVAGTFFSFTRGEPVPASTFLRGTIEFLSTRPPSGIPWRSNASNPPDPVESSFRLFFFLFFSFFPRVAF